ncbi:hypothetical protein [Streptomyces sp. SAS_270]|uniref:hypothetical protein n=1 Tax=Streptomyces sp. SAS_270 TaxID=3412748 RepID=UPI00403D37D1
MKRSLYCVVLLGMLCALVPVGSAGAVDDTTCTGDFAARLDCWSSRIHEGTVMVNLNDSVDFGGQKVPKDVAERIKKYRARLVVQVPGGQRSTGEGGTALLVMASERLVHPDAVIERLHRPAVQQLEDLGVCDPKNTEDLCDLLAVAGRQTGPLKGSDLIGKYNTGDLSTHTYSITGDHSGNKPAEGNTATASSGQHNNGEPGDGKSGTSNEDGVPDWLIGGMGALLVVLLAALVAVVHRSRAPAAPRRALAAPGIGALPTAHARGSDPRSASPGGADESTTRLRVAPAPRYGRQVGARTGPAHTATVRTALHPQGYVELDRILYRAVWAEPGRPPPAPGGLVDVTDARERDSDVLYAFPPAAGRHAKGAR